MKAASAFSGRSQGTSGISLCFYRGQSTSLGGVPICTVVSQLGVRVAPNSFALLGHTPCQPAVRATKSSQTQPGVCRTRTTVCSTCAKCMFSSTAKRWQWSTWRATRLSTGISVPHSDVTVWWSACCLLWARSACDRSRKLSTSDSN